ncbi:TonB-dependent receptor [Ideonella sp.]|uniref:TonB-dependent receptor n=1 Tax=Ideonella sp. TaxID=1929293 RepID=UPI003BB588F2
MSFSVSRAGLSAAGWLACAAVWAQTPQGVEGAVASPDAAGEPAAGGSSRSASVVVITGPQPTSLPTRIPTTVEGVSAERIAQTVNATDAEDALKYLPSLLVRKRYIGDYNHAVLSTRASGTGNSARSMVYADGILLSNFLGNGASFTPRWGLVSPEEIERVDVLYGPFSAAYAGNSVGAVVDYVTRLPKAFEAHAKLGYSLQPNQLYGQSETFHAAQASASLGNRQGDLAWWLSATHTDSVGQPLVFANKLQSAGGALKGGEVAVTGAVAGQNPRAADWWLVGSSTQYDTVQDQIKAKLAWDLSSSLRLNTLLALWQNRGEGQSRSWLRDADGATVDNRYSGDVSQAVNIGGKRYTLAASDFSHTLDDLSHHMLAVSLKTHTRAEWDWELAASQYRYDQDRSRAYAPSSKAAPEGGRLTRQDGTGWQTLAAKAVWRPQGGDHVVDAGLSQDCYQLRNQVDNTTDWRHGEPTSPNANFEGQTRTQALYLQDAWRFAPDWMAVMGLRGEQWRASNGLTKNALGTYQHPERSATDWSPKAAVSWALDEAWSIKASSGRAVRYPTVSELYQGGFNASGQLINNNPDLRPERGWTSELSAEWWQAGAHARSTLFHEDTRDALYSQLNPATNANTVQNLGHVRTTGLELAGGVDKVVAGLGLQGSLTFTDSKIVANEGYLLVPGDTVGKWQPRVPRWRATLLAVWQATDALSASLGWRISGRQYSALDNGDANGFAYQGASSYSTADVRVRYRVDQRWSLAFGIDNLNNQQYWNFHPYPQRSYSAELKYDL